MWKYLGGKSGECEMVCGCVCVCVCVPMHAVDVFCGLTFVPFSI